MGLLRLRAKRPVHFSHVPVLRVQFKKRICVVCGEILFSLCAGLGEDVSSIARALVMTVELGYWRAKLRRETGFVEI